MAPTEPVYFAHITDTHFGDSPAYRRHGFQPEPCARALVAALNGLPTRPDFVVHTGDVTSQPTTAAYRLARQVLGRLEMPVYYVNGNHDSAAAIRQHLSHGPLQDLSHDGRALAYAFEIKGYRFLALDARGPAEIDPHGHLPEPQLALLRREATAAGPPLTVFIHFPLHRLNSRWMDANMLVLNGDAVHQALLPARDRLRLVCHGHVHRSMQTVRDGILYVAAASAFAQFTAWPPETEVAVDPDYPPGFNFVHLLPDQTIVHQHVIARPGDG